MDRNGKLDQLIDDAEGLLTNLTDAHDPAIQDLRDKVDHAIGDARRRIAQYGNTAPVRWRDIAGTLDDYVRDYPWLAIATGVLLAGTVAFVAGSVTGSRKGGVYRSG